MPLGTTLRRPSPSQRGPSPSAGSVGISGLMSYASMHSFSDLVLHRSGHSLSAMLFGAERGSRDDLERGRGVFGSHARHGRPHLICRVCLKIPERPAGRQVGRARVGLRSVLSGPWRGHGDRLCRKSGEGEEGRAFSWIGLAQSHDLILPCVGISASCVTFSVSPRLLEQSSVRERSCLMQSIVS